MASETSNKKHANKSSQRFRSLPNNTAKVGQYLENIVAIIVEQGLGKTRASILTKQLINHGGKIASEVHDGNLSHLLVGNNVKLEKLWKVLKINEDELDIGIEIVRADWLSCCLKEGKLVELGAFRLRPDLRQNQVQSVEVVVEKQTNNATEELWSCSGSGVESSSYRERDSTVKQDDVCLVNGEDLDIAQDSLKLKESKSSRKRKRELLSGDDDGDSDYKDSGGEGSDTEEDEMVQPVSEIAPHVSPHKQKDHTWVCTKPSSSKKCNLNSHITEKLEVLENVYKNTNDQWRALGYKKAISSIKNYHKRIETLEECHSLPFVGERLAKKIWEIVQTGNLERLEHFDSKTSAINLFCNVWGAGPKTAEAWVSKGFTSLQDLEGCGNLTRQQTIGLKYYNEFLERMPRQEAEEIGTVVLNTAHSIDPGLQCEVCGSFRRGKPTCGDVDVLVSHSDGISHQGVMALLLQALKDIGFLTDDLTLMDNKNQRKYLGVCMLPGDNRKHRRIDIIVVPYAEWACALVYFTGSDYLNRSMRLLARKKDMSLTEHTLKTGVVRQGQERLTEGTPLPVSSEQDIFQYLGLDYLEPHNRDW